jgi:hypothetical protein
MKMEKAASQRTQGLTIVRSSPLFDQTAQLCLCSGLYVLPSIMLLRVRPVFRLVS